MAIGQRGKLPDAIIYLFAKTMGFIELKRATKTNCPISKECFTAIAQNHTIHKRRRYMLAPKRA